MGGPSAILALAVLASLLSCDGKNPTESEQNPQCSKTGPTPADAHTPESVVADWSQPVRLGAPVNTPCPEDAIEISRDGNTLYFLFTHDVLEGLSAEEILQPVNATYRAPRTGEPDEFGDPVFWDLGKGIDASLDGEPSFSPDGSKVYFHSLRATNTGWQLDPPVEDYQDIYVADIDGGEPGAGTNLGLPVNSAYPDGEHALHPDGVTLYFSSTRPGGLGKNDIWISSQQGTVWSMPENAGAPVNSSEDDLQPAFTADGNTMYFASGRDLSLGMAIYRTNGSGSSWGEPELVMKGMVGEPSITADWNYLYFVHVLMDSAGVIFDADVWLSTRNP
jgi:hypothetical protein